MTIPNSPAGAIPFVTRRAGSPVLVFIHGFLDAGNVWEPVMDSLARHDRHMVTLDLPGMGAQGNAEGPLTLTRLADAVCGVVDKIAEPVILIGHSTGTQLAELVARARPQAVKAMVLLTPIPMAGLPVPEPIAQAMRALGKNEPAQRQVRAQFSPGIDAAVMEQLVANGMQVKAENVAALFDAWSAGDPVAATAGPLDMPVLIVGGAGDPFSTPEVIAQAVAPRFPNSTTRILPDASHWPHVAEPAEIAESIAGFLDGLQA